MWRRIPSTYKQLGSDRKGKAKSLWSRCANQRKCDLRIRWTLLASGTTIDTLPMRCHFTTPSNVSAFQIPDEKDQLIELQATVNLATVHDFAFLNFMLLSRYGKNVKVEYRGSELEFQSKELAQSLSLTCFVNVVQIYMSGHGGDDFEEMSSQDLADSIQEMHVKKRCGRIIYFVMTLLH
ncbi:hypothetical protein PsorP6_011680 [Peronosclerospora sorghi]|uniref:Uncharacterized protein n=1 Tax=Peronosclerospora sorghi TaxID=230839 RepID=A0ACC0WIY6_9STRA|nr:hypothetical protein PsorP6_011680 [Peronosclerospora sorghi]